MATKKVTHAVASQSLAESLTYEQSSGNSTLDLEKALRSASYLLNWASRGCNEPLPQILAGGLAQVLDMCAEDVSKLFTHDDIIKSGGDLNAIRALRGRGPSVLRKIELAVSKL